MTAPDTDNGLILVDLRHLKHSLIAITLATFISVPAAVVVARINKEFRSTATFYADRSSRGVPAGLAELAASTGLLGQTTDSKSPYFYAALAKTRDNLFAVVGGASEASNRTTTIGDILLGRRMETLVDSIDAAKALAQSIEFRIDVKSGLVSIDAFNRDSTIARAIASLVFNQLDSASTQLRQRSARSRRLFLEDRLAAASEARDSAAKQLVDFSARNRQLSSSPALGYEQERLSQQAAFARSLEDDLQRQVVSARLIELDASSNLLLVETPRSEPLKSRPRTLHVLILVFPPMLLVALTALKVLRFSVSSFSSNGRVLAIKV